MSDTQYKHGSSDADDVDALARDADRRRERIEQTLDLLGGKLSPEHMKEQAFDLFREHGGDVVSGLQRSVKNNPVPLLLTGVGIAWMMMSQRDDRSRSEHYRHYSEFRQPPMSTRYIPSQQSFSDRHDSSGYSDGSADDGLMDKAADAKDKVADGVTDAWDSVTDGARDARDATGERLDSIRDRSAMLSNELQHRYRSASHNAGNTVDEWAGEATRFMREQPLVAGALGIAVGALLGGLMPTSDKEREIARRAVNSDAGQAAIDRSREVMDDAGKAASSHVEKAGQIAREKVSEVKESAKSEA